MPTACCAVISGEDAMSLDIDTILDGVVSHALASGWFERVNSAPEPKNAPGYGLTAAIWAQSIDPLPAALGLATTSARVVLMERIYSNMVQEPQDMIDPNVIKATDVLLAAYTGDFTLGGTFGHGPAGGLRGTLRAQAGYVDHRPDHVSVHGYHVSVNRERPMEQAA